MKTRFRLPLAAAIVAGMVACSGGDDGNVDPVADAGVDIGDAGVDTGDAGSNADAGLPTGECGKPANLAKREALTGAQPSIGVRSKSVLTAAITFASLADDPSVECSVELKFKDLNGNGELDAYENWTLSAEERATDLLARMSAAEKMGLMAHAATTDVPSGSNMAVSSSLEAMIADGVRFGRTAANSAHVMHRATWANNVQERCEASPLGIPFVLSSEPAHSATNRAKGFSLWPSELSLAASGDLGVVENFGRVVAQELRAIGVSMALSPSADLLTDPRSTNGQSTFGEDSQAVADMVAAYIKGAQGERLGHDSVACIVKHFPGAGPAKGGWDARLEKGKLLTYPSDNLDAHLAPFEKAFGAGVAGVMPGYGILETGNWSGLGGLIDGASIEQVGASFNQKLLTDVLRGHYEYSGLVLAPWGILEDAGGSAMGAPWGVESMSRAERLAKAVDAGVEQFGGLNDPQLVADAKAAGLITDAQIDAAARSALELIFQLGLAEDPYVDPAQAPAVCNADASYRAGLSAMNQGMVLLHNADKPGGWLNGDGDGSQSGDKGNAGNGSRKVLPAPPGEPYVAAGCAYFIMGSFDLDYVRSVSAGYGELTNDSTEIDGIPVETPEQRIARSDYVFIRMDAPFTADPDSGSLNYCSESLEYAGNANAEALADLAFARAAIDADPTSRTQIVVGVDAGRPSVVSELMGYGVSGLYYTWGASDKVFLDVAFGIVNGKGKLPVGLPESDAAVQDPSAQKEDLAGDGQHPTFVRGFGLQTTMF